MCVWYNLGSKIGQEVLAQWVDGPTMDGPTIYLTFWEKTHSVINISQRKHLHWFNTFNSGFSFIFLDLDSAGLYILENICFEAMALKVVAIIIQDKGTILIFQERG